MICINKSDCNSSKPLGMEDDSIPDNDITASSTHTNSKVAWGRLHYSQGSWTPITDTGYQWLQVNFVPEVKLITHIATQGNGKNWWWVKEYYVMYRKGGRALQEYMEKNQNVVSWNTRITSCNVIKKMFVLLDNIPESVVLLRQRNLKCLVFFMRLPCYWQRMFFITQRSLCTHPHNVMMKFIVNNTKDNNFFQ